MDEIIPSQKEKEKINVCGYLMVKEWNRDDLFYWCCEKRKSENCKGWATTVLFNIYITLENLMIIIVLLKLVMLKLLLKSSIKLKKVVIILCKSYKTILLKNLSLYIIKKYSSYEDESY